jgi:proteasome lid subunit RPN8/RPN11
MKPTVNIPSSLWHKTQKGLATRGAGERESACLWVGQRGKEIWSVKGIIFLDDIPGTISNKRFHHTPKEVVNKIYQVLRKEGLQIIADVHTHPGRDVEMSDLDKNHPIEYRVGLLSLILPNYGFPPITLRNTGFHEYLGNDMWTQIPYRNVIKRITITEDE